jgi:hypothetical protein
VRGGRGFVAPWFTAAFFWVEGAVTALSVVPLVVLRGELGAWLTAGLPDDRLTDGDSGRLSLPGCLLTAGESVRLSLPELTLRLSRRCSVWTGMFLLRRTDSTLRTRWLFSCVLE